MRSVSACFVVKSTKYLMVFVSTASDCAVCFLNMSTSSLSAEADSLSTNSLASRASVVGNSRCMIGPVPLLWDDPTSMGTSLFDLGLTCFAITVPIGFGKVEVSRTSQLGVRTATQLNKQGFKELRLDAEKYRLLTSLEQPVAAAKQLNKQPVVPLEILLDPEKLSS